MKIYTFTAILSFFLLRSFAQAYTPIKFGNTRWLYNEYFFSKTKSSCYFSKDTNGYYFGGNKYWRIEAIDAPTYTTTTGGFYIFDDTISKKVYHIDTATNKIQILYDFSANTGDTIKGIANLNVYIGTGIDTVIVDSIKYSLVKSINRKHVYFHSLKFIHHSGRPWIEGIGGIYDFQNPTREIIDPSFSLSCLEYNSIINYEIGSGCANFFNNIEDIQLSQHYSIYPNPSTGIFNILNNLKPFSSETTLQLFDITGKLVYTNLLGGSNFLHTIQLPNSLDNGLYMVKLIESESDIFITKIAIQN